MTKNKSNVRVLKHPSIGEAYHACAARIIDKETRFDIAVKLEKKDHAMFIHNVLHDQPQYIFEQSAINDILKNSLTNNNNKVVENIREAFLSDKENYKDAVDKFIINSGLGNTQPKIVVWIRHNTNGWQEERNSTPKSTRLLIEVITETLKDENNLQILLIGDLSLKDKCYEYELSYFKDRIFNYKKTKSRKQFKPRYYEDNCFKIDGQIDIRRELLFFHLMREKHGLLGNIGVVCGGMDGPAFIGIPTIEIGRKKEK